MSERVRGVKRVKTNVSFRDERIEGNVLTPFIPSLLLKRNLLTPKKIIRTFVPPIETALASRTITQHGTNRQ